MSNPDFRLQLYNWAEPKPQPLITEVVIAKNDPVEVRVFFRIDGKQKLWPRLKMAFRYFWYIASGRLQWAILAKFNP